MAAQYDGLSLYFRALGKLEPLSKEDELLLGKQIAESKDVDAKEQAKQRLAEGSSRFVIHLAKEIQKKKAWSDIRDLSQAGYLGLMTAIDKYDYKLEIRFSTFSYWWIKKAMYESVTSQQNLVSVPKGLREQIGKYKKTFWQLRNSLSREPSLAEISIGMNLPEATVEMIAIAVHQEELVYLDHKDDESACD